MVSEIREFNGVRYYRYPHAKRASDRKYFKRQGKYLHRVVWEFHNGPIPAGHEIHHKDEDPGNNAIDNLETVRKCDHIPTKHPNIVSPERVEFFHRVVRPLALEWHHSDEGREWHSRHAKEQRQNAVLHARKCRQCGTDYDTRQIGGRSDFCSNACRAASRRDSGVDDVEARCRYCGDTFKHNRFIARSFCSRACSNRARCGIRDGVQPDG
jgi:endogenous inhibitor of DNA gyrase (YacG/DUF329 family)